ncbi:uncharacterized protein [Panulirus ornatus]|uniref:uncharacterized protein n=1 Tax=Panulirus ornatus TaxID=150431 RepID=UPI003A8BB275
MEIAHEGFSGHLGIKKTYLKLLNDFYWPESDSGTNFTSDLFKDVLQELGIKQTLSTAYHPQSQGALERHHQTLKSMIRKYCHERNWDERLPFLLFAVRESPHESLGCSPFELVFGRKVRGPHKVVKDKLISHKVPLKSVTTYLQQLKDNLDKIRKCARNNLKISQHTMKSVFDVKAKVRNFQEGDKVLAYFPITGSPLSAKYHGPYTIKSKVNDYNYIISTPGRREATQFVHVNLLKPFLSQDPARDQIGLPCNVIGSQVDNTLDTSSTTNNWKGHSNSDILQDLPKFLAHLQREQAKEVSSVLLSHSSVISDTPGHCTIMSHDVVLIPGTNPISQPPHRILHQKREQMKKEVDYLLHNNLAVPSCSPGASPCLLVPKEDRQLRLCTDYRRLNSVTQSDAYPLPRIDDLIDTVGQSKYISKIDLNKGIYQIPLTKNAQTISAFITPFGLYEYRVMPFGMRNSPGTFQRTMNFLFQDLDKVEVYLDDIIVYSDTWYNHMHRLSAVLRKLQDAYLTIKLAKSTFCSAWDMR